MARTVIYTRFVGVYLAAIRVQTIYIETEMGAGSW